MKTVKSTSGSVSKSNALLNVAMVCILGIITAHSNSAQANIRRFDAQYTVPVADPLLQDVATFKLENYKVDSTDEALGQADLEYTIPATLLGYEQAVKLFMTAKRQEVQSGKAVTVREFAGRDGDAICVGAWDKMRCEVKFALKPDFAALEAMFKISKDPRAAERMEIARVFGGDPIGITETK